MARKAGVSITTVSRVLNKVPTVNKEIVQRVEGAISDMKFKPNPTAQRLAKGIQNTAVGFVIPGYPGIFHSFYAVELMRGIGHGCETLRLDLIFHITDGSNPLRSNFAGGLIFADIIENLPQVQTAVAEGMPCLVINHIVKDLQVSYIAVDNVKGSFMAAEYLVNLGHKRIATVTGNMQTQAGIDRFEGFQKALKQHNIDCPTEYVHKGDYSRRSARQAAERFFSLENPPTAIFAASDDMAMEIVSVSMENGIKVPEDISIIGFDDNPAGLFGPVGLTTIKQPLFTMGEEAVRVVYEIMTGKQKGLVHKVLAPDLIVRESCAQPSS
ncbi:MAG: LacI family DNA-binding transcriptional regulator [Candidatus Omnitrophica bacterium]|nr:LacI family DNA-binding transcriptional regulator [Candidatus Omnitrophota bacterium]MDE2010459.1 LacI family DNA-binding transcriptional regulator [Candidatus Omnitrophota bacterium]MDE2215106.1 LacI family DNA-binding transcriptional regulator [Candidatus Omnitrophota bacterium]MDE2232067.1 LacI family DNA-binding transcriptional regulator [Candidatus Omnitrophota bacterium]